MERRWYRDIKRALERHGITALGHETGGRHAKVKITDGKYTCHLFTSISPSDSKALLQIVKTAKASLNRTRELS